MSGNQLYIYSALFTILCCFSTSMVGLIRMTNLKKLKFLPFYPLLSGIQISISLYFDFRGDGSIEQDNIDLAFINLFLLVEFLILYRFYILLFKSTIATRVFSLLTIVYPLLLIGYWIFKRAIFMLPSDIFIVHSAIIILPAVIYLVQLPNKPIVFITNDPYFWIIIGIVCYFGCTLPLFLLKDFIFDKDGLIAEDGLYAINFICYSIMFLFFAKAYLCILGKKENA